MPTKDYYLLRGYRVKGEMPMKATQSVTGEGKEPVGSALLHLHPGAAPFQPVCDDPQRQPDPGKPQQGQVPGGDHSGEGLHPGDRPGRLPQEADQHLPADQI